MVEALPRAIGDGLVRVRRKGDKSALSDLRMSGCLKVLFARPSSRVDAILINSSGGLTSGDRLNFEIGLEAGAVASVTTQAAERAYRAEHGPANVTTRVRVSEGGQILWLPQELILFDGAKLDRKIHFDLEPEARCLLVEPVIFGRAMMGEVVEALWFRDRISLDRDGLPLYRDTTQLSGDMRAVLAGPAIGRGAGAMASLVYVAPDAEHHCKRISGDLPETVGASLVREDVMILRVLARDGFELRRSLLPVLDRLTNNTLPPSWRL